MSFSYYEKFHDGSVICIDEAIPFDIPESWQWVRLNSLAVKEIKRGKAPKYSETVTSTLVFAQKCNLKAGGIKLSLAKYLDETALPRYSKNEFLMLDDIVINSTGTGTLGRVGMIIDGTTPTVADSHITVIRTTVHVSSSYIYYVLKESQTVFENSGEGSTNQKELRPNTLMSFLVPLPPLNEQLRIVTTVANAQNTLQSMTERIN